MVPREGEWKGMVPGGVHRGTGTWGWGAVECSAVDRQPSGAEIMANSKGGRWTRRLGVRGGEGNQRSTWSGRASAGRFGVRRDWAGMALWWHVLGTPGGFIWFSVCLWLR